MNMSISTLEFLARYLNPINKTYNASHRAILGIDYGTQKCGLSLTFSLDEPAFPLKLIRASHSLARSDRNAVNLSYIDQLKPILSKNHVFGIVLGMPVTKYNHMNNQECVNTLDFLKAMSSNQISLPVVLWNEENTTSFAKETLIEMRNSPRGHVRRSEFENVDMNSSLRRRFTHIAPEHRQYTDLIAATAMLNGFLRSVRRNAPMRSGG
jgi:RNase H-fold protein (predicted Holliday junction resolvase)